VGYDILVCGELWEIGNPLPSAKPHICIKVMDRYIFISSLDLPNLTIHQVLALWVLGVELDYFFLV